MELRAQEQFATRRAPLQDPAKIAVFIFEFWKKMFVSLSTS